MKYKSGATKIRAGYATSGNLPEDGAFPRAGDDVLVVVPARFSVVVVPWDFAVVVDDDLVVVVRPVPADVVPADLVLVDVVLRADVVGVS